MIVVIPSNRPVELAHLQPLIDAGARFVVVDDSEGTVKVDHPAFRVYNWADRKRMLGTRDRHFPRRNGACRDFGFWLAWQESDPGEAIVALDDDCRVTDADFAARVEAALSPAPRPIVTCAGTHLNILDLYADNHPRLFPRGFPYSARLDADVARPEGQSAAAPAFALGLWRGVFDINAVDKVSGRAFDFADAKLRVPSAVVAPGRLVSVCSMNMQFRRELIPAAFQLPMHVEVVDDGVIDRFGDIWGGFILKTVMDVRGDAMAVGEPMIDHLKDGNHVRNIWQENLGHQLNDEFLDVLAVARDQLVADDPLAMMGRLTELFAAQAPHCSPLLRRYFATLVPALDAWVSALDEVAGGRASAAA